jgi:hypothetical protein
MRGTGAQELTALNARDWHAGAHGSQREGTSTEELTALTVRHCTAVLLCSTGVQLTAVTQNLQGYN